MHSKIEGTYEYTLLLFIPSRAPFDLWIPQAGRGIKLHIRRVFVLEDSGQLMPQYLRFVRGVIDSADLPLNVSRELLQGSRVVDNIRSNATKKVLRLLADIAEKEPEKYATFWKEFGAVLKEGLPEDFGNRDEIARLLRFTSTTSASDEPDVSLADYVSRMKEGQQHIYYLLAPGLAAAKASPHLEAFRKKGIEVLLLGDGEGIDNWVVASLREFDGKRLQSVAQGSGDLSELEDEAEAEAKQQASAELAGLVGQLKAALGERAYDVRVSSRADHLAGLHRGQRARDRHQPGPAAARLRPAQPAGARDQPAAPAGAAAQPRARRPAPGRMGARAVRPGRAHPRRADRGARRVRRPPQRPAGVAERRVLRCRVSGRRAPGCWASGRRAPELGLRTLATGTRRRLPSQARIRNRKACLVRWLTGRMTGRKLRRACSAPLPPSRPGARSGGSPTVTMPSAFPHATHHAHPEPQRCHIVAVLTASMSHRGGWSTARMRHQLSQVPRSPHGALAVCCQTSVHIVGISQRLRPAHDTRSRRHAGSPVVPGRLLAVSDLHVSHPRNRRWVADLPSGSPGDWLLVAGDLAEKVEDIEWTLRTLRSCYGTVVWVPGNHDLWAHPRDPVKLRGEARYQHLVALCRELGVITPEDPYPVWTGAGGPAVIVPLFLLYDYTFRPDGTSTKAEALDLAYRTGVIGADERHLHPDPYPSREAWCQARIDATLPRLAAIDPDLPTILVSHFPLTREPTRILRYPVFAQWCGTEQTADWHRRFRARTVVYGHLHIPRTMFEDGVRFEEVSLGYPYEQDRHPERPRQLIQILPPGPARTLGPPPADGNVHPSPGR